jgi:hypothetical protein
VQYRPTPVNNSAIATTSGSSPSDSASTSMANTVSLSDSDQHIPDSLPSAITGIVTLVSNASSNSCDTGALEMQQDEATNHSTASLEGYESVNSILPSRCME